MNFTKVSVCLLVLFSLLALGYVSGQDSQVKSVQCYVCNSNEDSACGESLTSDAKNKYLSTCESGLTHCRQIVQIGNTCLRNNKIQQLTKI